MLLRTLHSRRKSYRLQVTGYSRAWKRSNVNIEIKYCETGVRFQDYNKGFIEKNVTNHTPTYL